jgi:hypothetical protein
MSAGIQCDAILRHLVAERLSGAAVQLSYRHFQLLLPRLECKTWISSLEPGEDVVLEIPLPQTNGGDRRRMRCSGRVMGWSLESRSHYRFEIEVSRFAIRADRAKLRAVPTGRRPVGDGKRAGK